MPQFSYHTPTSQGDMAARRKANKSLKQKLPTGKIGENTNFSWGYNGEYYYVCEGVLEHLITNIHLTLEEAKRLFESLSFIDSSEPCPKSISQAIKGSRKDELKGDDLMWFFVDALSVTN